MNITFIGETDVLGFSIYLDHETAAKQGYKYCSPEGIYFYYYEGKKREGKAPLERPIPCIFV
jgi:hypothetical protein